eukprot:scpid76001/ scgid33244/ 
MGGVDRNDEMLSFYTAARKPQERYRKLATHVLEAGLLNSYVLYRKKAQSAIKHSEFMVRVTSSMLDDGKRGMIAAVAGPFCCPRSSTCLSHTTRSRARTRHARRQRQGAKEVSCVLQGWHQEGNSVLLLGMS